MFCLEIRLIKIMSECSLLYYWRKQTVQKKVKVADLQLTKMNNSNNFLNYWNLESEKNKRATIMTT